MKSLWPLAILAVATSADAEPLGRIDFLRCLSSMERVSTARMMSAQVKPHELTAAMACVDAHRQLDLDKGKQLLRVYETLQVQLDAPSALAHSELVTAST